MMAKRLGYLRTASTASSFEVRVPQHRVDQCPVDAGLIHARYRLLSRIGLLAMVRGRRALFPEMDLCVDDQHWCAPSA